MVSLIQASLRKQPERLAVDRQCVARVRIIFYFSLLKGKVFPKVREEMV